MEGPAADGRTGSIDVLKAWAIVTVVYIHACGHAFQMDAPPVEAFLTWWAVPAFFFASGFLRFRAAPISRALLGRWLRRLLVPYGIATLLALVVHGIGRGAPSPAQVLFDLLAGAAWGIYYFVPVLTGALLITPLLARAGRAEVCCVLFWATGLLANMGLDPIERIGGIFWLLRSPFAWWGYFLAGWVTAKHRAALDDASPLARRVLGVGVLLVALGAFVVHRATAPWSLPAGGAMLYGTNYCLIVAILALAHGVHPPRLVLLLSTTTYPIYLYHIFFTAAVRERAASLGAGTGAVALAAGFLGPALIVALGRRLLGARARLLLG